MTSLPSHTVVSLKQMRRCPVQFAVVLLAMFSVAVNALCSTKCIVASGDLSPKSVPVEQDHPCHHGNSTAPTDGDQACQHPHLFANDSSRTVVPVPASGMFLAVVPGPRSIGINLISPASVIALEAPRPSFPDVVSTRILRV